MLASAGTGFGFFGSREQKYRDAADLYVQAANAFRMQNLNREAGKAFEAAVPIQRQKLDEPDEAANSLLSAFKVYREKNPEDAARCLEDAIQYYTSHGNFRRAAKQKEDLGELYEELQMSERALHSYEKAAAWYETDGAQALANKNWLKVAELSAVTEKHDYYKSIEIFERVAQKSISSNLMRYSVKEYFLKAGLCHLATGDIIATQRGLEKYRDIDPSFATTREHQLLVDLSEAVEGGDADRFSEKLFQYDQMSKLDKWKTAVLLQIKSKIEEADNEFS
ncbi:alpha-soluble NSF attachment protein [Sporothrix schenckii 1099-18]|nr:alpha-soluble NSF attachment protein [Sporothrix schenckii 1099-18]KJR83894.1 alpha-soluble NSF attachment protein [Sporothrix schenckii 1099-18]